MMKLRKLKMAPTKNTRNTSKLSVDTVVVGMQGTGFSKRQRYMVAAAACLLAFTLGTYFIVRSGRVPVPEKVDLQGLTEYSDMSRDQADYYLYKNTGLSFEYLNKKGISGKHIKSFESALQAAQAFASIQEKHKALQAYAVAEEKKPNDGTYQFHVDYAHYALSAGDRATWKKEMLLARDIAAKNQKKVVYDKYSLSPVDRINSEIVIVEGSSNAKD